MLRIAILLVALSQIGSYARIEFNNVICKTRNESYLTFDHCYLKSFNRTFKYVSIKAKNRNYIHNSTVSVVLYRRDTSFVPYGFNVTVDGCQFLKLRANPIANYLFGVFEKYSNLNHTCPYEHDFIVDMLPINHVDGMMGNIISNGRYVLFTSWKTYGIERCIVTLYFTRYS